MTWTFTDAPATVPTDAVRLHVGDTNPDDPLVSNEAIAWALTQAGGSVIMAAARVARMIAMQFARQVDFTSDKIRLVVSQRAKAYMALVEQLDAAAGIGIGSGMGGLIVEPVVTGVSVGEMDAVAQNPDRPGSPWPEFEGHLLDGITRPCGGVA